MTSSLESFFKAVSESAILIKKQVEVNLLHYFTAIVNKKSACFGNRL